MRVLSNFVIAFAGGVLGAACFAYHSQLFLPPVFAPPKHEAVRTSALEIIDEKGAVRIRLGVAPVYDSELGEISGQDEARLTFLSTNGDDLLTLSSFWFRSSIVMKSNHDKANSIALTNRYSAGSLQFSRESLFGPEEIFLGFDFSPSFHLSSVAGKTDLGVGSVSLYDSKGTEGIGLSYFDTAPAGIGFKDDLDNDPNPYLTLRARGAKGESKSRLTLTVDNDGEPRISLADSKDRPRVSIGSTELLDSRTGRKISRDAGSIVLFGEDQQALWAKPAFGSR